MVLRVAVGLALLRLACSLSPIAVHNITYLGSQLTPDVTNVSRDGGYSTLVNGNIVFLYDDSECFDSLGNQLSFISNTAAYANQPNTNLRTAKDFGVMNLGKDKKGIAKNAILAGSTVETGGWIKFSPDELDFNQQKKGVERVAICESPLIGAASNLLMYLTIQGQERRRRRSASTKPSCSHHLSMLTANHKILPKSTSLGE